MITIDTIATLNWLIAEKRDRLTAINKRLTQLRFEIRNPNADLDALQNEILELGQETDDAVSFIRKATKTKAQFYRPATM